MTDDTPSTLPKIMLGLLLGMCVVVAIVVITDQPDGNRGQTHGDYPATMMEGGSGVERLGGVRWLGLAFALCQVGIYVGTMVLGMRRSTGRTTVIAMVGLLYAASFVALAVVDLQYARGDVRTIVGGLPLPTAIMIYAVGGIPVLFIAIYTLFFDSWVLTPDEQARIEQLAARYQEQQESSA